MDKDINALKADIIALQEQNRALQERMAEMQLDIDARFATKAYVSTFVEHMLGDIIPVDTPLTEESPIAGYVPLDIERIEKHFGRAQQYYNSVDWRTILTNYDNAAKRGNINPYIAIAQMVKETDWGRSFWSRRPQRNPAGIGVTGQWSIEDPRTPDNRNVWAFNTDRNRWEYGYSFPSWEISAQAHIGHLLTYLYKQSTLTEDQVALVAIDPRSKAVSDKVRGTIKLLKDLDGKWAVPGLNYGRSIATLANALKQ